MKAKKMPADLKTQTLRDKNAMIIATVCIMIFVLASALVVCFDSYESMKKAALKNVQETLSQSKSKLELVVSHAADSLNYVSQKIDEMQEKDSTKISKILQSGKENSIFSSLGIKFEGNKAITDQNKIVNGIEWENKTHLESLNVDASVGTLTMSTTDAKQVVRLFVPSEPTSQDAMQVYGVIDEQKLAQNFEQTRYGSDCDIIIFESKSGNVIMKTGDTLDLTGSKIGVLGSHGQESKRIFKDIIKNKSGYTNINSKNTNIVCVYSPVGIGDWYMMYAVSEQALIEDFKDGIINLIIICVVTVVSMLILAVYAYKKTKRARNATDNVLYEVNLREKIFSLAFAETSIRVFLYNKSDNRITVLKDADGTYSGSKQSESGVDYISEYEMLDANDTRRMKNIMALAGTDGSIKLTVKSNRTKPSTVLKYSFSTIKTVQGDDNVIICTAYELPEIKKQKIDVENLENPAAEYKTTCLELFLESNRYKCVWNNEPVMESKLQTGVLVSNYDNDFKRKLLPEVKSQDRQTFTKNMNRLNLLEFFRSGKTEFSFDFHIKTTKPSPDDYELRMIDVYLLRDKKTDEVKANVYIRNLDITPIEEI